MQKLAFNITGYNAAVNSPANALPSNAHIGDVITGFLPIIFYVAVFLAFIWLVWGAFQWLFAGSNKEAVAKARARITWAIAGLIIVLLAYTISQYAKEIFPGIENTDVTTITNPDQQIKP